MFSDLLTLSSFQDYVITMMINSPDYKLNLKLILKDKQASGNVDMKAEKYEKPKHRKVSNLEGISLGSTSKI